MTRNTFPALLLSVALLATSAGPSTGGPPPAPTPAGPQFGRGTLNVHQGGRRVTLHIEVASTVETRSYGLMFRKSLPENAGMLFVFEQDARWGFWMKNTLIPLSIGFIDSKWRLLEVQDMTVASDSQNGPWPIYEPKAPYRYALEVNQGFFQRKGIAAGARFEFSPAK